jgi:RNA polymerase sigma-70 factor (ECF subfamily)
MVRGVVTRAPPLSKEATLGLERERKFLWGVCYRMTGSASDAEDIVQEAFVRALEKPPADTSAAWRPWLVRVAMNLSRDQLRRRKRRGYDGAWLPTPIEGAAHDAVEHDAADTGPGPEVRYGLMESASYAFLVALEALTPSQRAVLVLRDTFDYSSREAANLLDMSEENVRITLHRARKAMAEYDEDRPLPGKEHDEALHRMLGEMMSCFAANDVEGLCRLLSKDVRLVGDGGGVHHTGRAPVLGREKIARMYMKLGTRASAELQMEVKALNGMPGVVTMDPAPQKPNAPRAVLIIHLGRSGRVRAIFSILAPDKLRHVRFPPAAVSAAG